MTKLEIFSFLMIKKFEIFPSLKELKESLLKAYEQHLKKNLVSPVKLESLNTHER